MQNINRLHIVLFCLFFFQTLSLVACFPASPEEIHRAACNDLKSRIVFNGATSDTRRSEIERAQQPLNEYTYDRHCESRY